MSRDDPHFRLRLSADIRDWLKKKASENLRSMTAEINLVLKERMEADSLSQKEKTGHQA